MTTAQVVKTSVTVNNNSPIQDYVHPDDQTQPTFEMTPGFKPFTSKILLAKSYSILPVRLKCIIDKALFLLFFIKVSIAHLHVFDTCNCESEKRSYCFGKSLEKILNFGSKYWFKSWKERLSYNCHYLTLTPFTYPA